MEIKRLLVKAAGRLTPQIEVMNIGVEMRQLVKRLNELITYGEQKQEQARHKKESMGVIVDRHRRLEREEIAAIHSAEADEMAKDQEQNKAQPGSDPRSESERIADEAQDNGAVANAG